jgi:hypothetical protein
LARKVECGNLAAKDSWKLAKIRKKKRKHTSSVAVHHLLSDPPNATSHGVPEATMRKGGRQWTRRHKSQCNSEVARKKMWMKHG